MTLHNTRVIEGFEVIARALNHPTNPTAQGDLWRNKATGVYSLACAGTLVSVPQEWAADLDLTLADRTWRVQHPDPPYAPAVKLGRRGGRARARRLTAEERSEAARQAAQARWAKRTDE